MAKTVEQLEAENASLRDELARTKKELADVKVDAAEKGAAHDKANKQIVELLKEVSPHRKTRADDLRKKKKAIEDELERMGEK